MSSYDVFILAFGGAAIVSNLAVIIELQRARRRP